MAQDDIQHESIELQGELEGHKGWVTCIATAMDDSNMILSGSRDKSIVVWDLERNQRDDGNDVVKGTMKRRLVGHNHFISDIDISGDRQFALSSSWDGTLRLWKLQTGQLHKAFVGHKKDVLSVAFSADNRQIVSGSVDRTVKVWNTIGVCQYTMEEENTSHKDWVTCVRFSPDQEKPVVVSAGRDRLVKVWDAERDMELKYNLAGHTGYVNSVTVSPDGSLCASGGKDGVALLWDLHEGKALSSLEAKEEIHALCFSPNRYWLCGAVGSSIKIWDLETKDVVGTLKLVKRETKDASEKKKPRRKPLDIICTCLAWSHDGKTLYAGYSDGRIRVWVLSSPAQDDAASDEN